MNKANFITNTYTHTHIHSHLCIYICVCVCVYASTSNKKTVVRPLNSDHKNHTSKTNKTCGTLLEKRGRTRKWCFSYEALHTVVPVLADQQELIYISSVRTQDVVWKTCQERWIIEMDGGRDSAKSVLSARLDDIYIYIYIYIYISLWISPRLRIFISCRLYCFFTTFRPLYPQVSPVYLCIETISQIESFLCPDKQGTPEEGRRIQQPKRCEKTITTKTIVRKLLLIKIIKLRLRNSDSFTIFLIKNFLLNQSY